MKLTLVNDRGKKIAHIKIKNGRISDEDLDSCFIVDIDDDDDHSLHYKIQIIPSSESVETLSSDTLLNELRDRLEW